MITNITELFDPSNKETKEEFFLQIKEAEFEQSVEDYVESIRSMVFAINHEAEKFDIEQFDIWKFLQERV